jgi:flagellar biosynthesis protein FlhF
MTPRKFVAPSAREAMARIREEIGPDAVILANRKVEGGVVITALDEASLADWEARVEPPAPRAPAAPAAEMSTVSFQRYAQERRRQAMTREEGPGAVAREAAAASHEPPAPVSSRSSAPRTEDTPTPRSVTFASHGRDETPHPGAGAATHEDMARVVSELRKMRSFISQQFGALSSVDGVRRTPAQARILRRMQSARFSPRLARALVGSLPRDSAPAEADHWLHDTLSRNLGVACFEQDHLERGGVFALVGPTGVGKTTSAAKLAAQCALRHGAHKVGLIGIDTYRVAAQDQLRRYGDMIGIDVQTVRDGTALLDTLSRMSDKHLVLIDTVGLGQRDPRIERMLEGLSASVVQRLIVISAAAQAEAIDETLAAYRAEQASGALLTKVDEACRLGGALDALIRYRVPLVGVGNGQRVPEDWQRPDARGLIARALEAGRGSGRRGSRT